MVSRIDDGKDGDEYILHRNSTFNNRKLCVFVHGYGGDNTEDYWGFIPENLRWEQSISDYDLCYWRYPTSSSPFANYFSLIKRGKKISDLDEVSHSLKTTLILMANTYGYDNVILFGHSMGGIVCIKTAKILIDSENIKVKRLCLMATPKSPIILAKILSVLRGNPHISFMSDFKSMNKLFRSIVPILDKAGIPVRYMRYTLDELVSFSKNIQFDKHSPEMYAVKHHWFLEGNPEMPAYQGIVKLIQDSESDGK